MNDYKTIVCYEKSLDSQIKLYQCFGWKVNSCTPKGDSISVILERTHEIPNISQLNSMEKRMETLLKRCEDEFLKQARAEIKYTTKKAAIFVFVGLLIPTFFMEKAGALWAIKIVLMAIGAGLFAAKKLVPKKHNKMAKQYSDEAYELAAKAMDMLQGV